MEKKLFIHFFTCLAMVIGCLSLTACGDDDEKVEDFGDYYLKFELIDKGTFTNSEANQFIGILNSDVEPMEGVSKDEAVYYYNKAIQNLKNEFGGTNDFEVSFRVRLMNNSSTVKSQDIYISRTGCVVK